MHTIRYTVPAIHCGHCVATIERVVSVLPGVSRVTGDMNTKKVEVDYEAPATPEQIAATMAEWDYPPDENEAFE
jgi:Cu+-exporting ATPase